MKTLTLYPLPDIPLVKPGDIVSELIWNSLVSAHMKLETGDVIVVAQKVISKAEGRLRNLTEILPSKEAVILASKTGKDARFVELVLNECKKVIRTGDNLLIVEHKLGFICANAGIDHSNVHGYWGKSEDWYLLLPEDPDKSAMEVKQSLETKSGCRVGVLIIDSHGRAWRLGTIGTTIGIAGIPALVDLRGQPDLFGYKLRITQVAASDELAAAASLLMGQADEATPVILARGYPYPLRNSKMKELIRPEDEDLFR
jgi:coenzyme F420-0:L-glutamate ligase / coenzyme F420-1:gamma-L-glutamate ligase